MQTNLNGQAQKLARGITAIKIKSNNPQLYKLDILLQVVGTSCWQQLHVNILNKTEEEEMLLL